jgi:MGT family glycosyltransferase
MTSYNFNASTPLREPINLYQRHLKEAFVANLLVAVTPVPGHINPMLTVAKHLSAVGHSIIFLSGELFREQAVSAGFRFVPLEGKANFNYKTIDEDIPERTATEPGPDRINADCTYLGVEPIPDQHRAIQQIMAKENVDLILVDDFFWGVVPMLLGPKTGRPPIVACGVVPMLLTSYDTSPFSGPDNSPEGLLRNLQETQQFYEMFSPTNARFNEVMHACGAPDLPEFFLDCSYNLPDRFLMFTAEAFEFPRGDLKESIQFVGGIMPTIQADFRNPDWWGSLDGSRPTILVTQGTLANTDLSQVIEPAIAALADQDLTVIAAIGRPDLDAIQLPSGVKPDNTKIEAFVPFDQLLPKVDVFVTNGGYGSVNLALSMGVPIVIAGDTEEKAFTAARIAWSGAGISLGTGRPNSEQILSAVQTILSDRKYRDNAKRLQKEFARYNTMDLITTAIEPFLMAGKADPSL